ncbi:ParA family protein [Riemerella anatipestifer]|uniref:ParA family protein n=1 Tax=Riemerella anatipestifer TaxID=34085 RepID=UPI00069950A6|nr:ParA family protein [Riemerella anatipestifer]MDR7693406.1 ParA family protein [Riemerella anatipestifer]MDY3528853.1 ParA family protein [Riemerella anatipestifer]MDY3538068.1 ParA family protein [Riemerella anatipestifer]
MIITFGTQKGGAGKTTLAIAFANYLSLQGKKLNVFDFDFQKSFYQKWEEDEILDIPKLYEVKSIGDSENIVDFNTIMDMKESEDIYLFDLAGTIDDKYTHLLVLSDYIVIPFEYSDVSVKSTLVFIELLSIIESEAQMIFVRSKYDKGYNYMNQEEMDKEISKYGKILENPIYKRNCLQNITTRKLTYEQKHSVKPTFDELITYINATL